VSLTKGDRRVLGFGAMVFWGFTMVLAFAALIVAGQAWQRSSDAKSAVAKLAAGGIIGTTVRERLQEFSITPTVAEVKAGPVTFDTTNRGSITHEMVIVHGPVTGTLPIVTTSGGERALGAIDEEAIAEADIVGETGDVKPGATVAKRFKLTPGNYVMFCNIDNKAPDGTVTNHYQRGMVATLVAR